jgi:hypothetical protein
MESIEFKGKVLEGKYLSLPRHIIARIKGAEQVKVTLELADDPESDQLRSTTGENRMRLAFEQYKAKYPDDDVTLDDFRYVGILSEGGIGEYKDDLVDAIEAKYNDI